VLFPERNAWCAFWRNRAGGTNGGGGTNAHNAEGAGKMFTRIGWTV